MQPPKRVPFLTVEDEDEWVVSFAFGPQGAERLTLKRTPRLEFMLRPEQRGVFVGVGVGTRPAPLVAVQWGAKSVDVVSTERRYSIDTSKMDGNLLNAALLVLGKMNFDQRFQLAGV